MLYYKKIIALIALVTAAAYCNVISAYDIIVMNNGDLINAKVEEVGPTEIKYRKASNMNGPLYKIETKTVLAINYENGEKDVFNVSQQTDNAAKVGSLSEKNDKAGPREIPPIPAADNEELISRINNCTVRHGKRKPDEGKLRTTKKHTWIMGVTPNSILSDQNISVDFIHTYDSQIIEKGKTRPSTFSDPKYFKGTYKIYIRNKTSHPIYIDMSNSFRIWPGGKKNEPFYNNVSITNTSGQQNSGSLGLGAVTNVLGIGGVVGQIAHGVGIGKSSINSTSVTITENNIVTIPPDSEIMMPSRRQVWQDGSIFIEYECINPHGVQQDVYKKVTVNHTDKIEKNRYVALPNDQISEGMSYYITYSTTPDFATYTSLPFGFYVRGMFGSEGNYDEFTSDDGKVIIGT